MNFRKFFLSSHWWGKLIGAFFGYLLGGPSGALFGILIGNFFDRAMYEHLNNPHWSFHAEKRQEIQRIFFEATFSVMGYLAKADGRVTEEEIEAAKTLMDEMRLNRSQKNLAKQFFSIGKTANFDLGATLSLLQTTSRANPALLNLFMDIQYRVAKVGGLTEKKVQALDTIFRYMGFAPLRQQYRFYEDFGFNTSGSYHQRESSNQNYSYRQNRSYRNNSDSLAQAYAILEVDPGASKQEVKKAYRRMISRNHPDKLIAQGLPEEMIKLANNKTQKITKAYEQICLSKGW